MGKKTDQGGSSDHTCNENIKKTFDSYVNGELAGFDVVYQCDHKGCSTSRTEWDGNTN